MQAYNWSISAWSNPSFSPQRVPSSNGPASLMIKGSYRSPLKTSLFWNLWGFIIPFRINALCHFSHRSCWHWPKLMWSVAVHNRLVVFV